MAPDEAPMTTQTQQQLNDAILYALRAGCFFHVPEPKSGASLQAWVQWGALRHFHDAVAAHFREMR